MSQAQYRIRAVSEMTGVPSPTLRAWERRYGVPEPRRTDSSYRLYDESDVRMINRLRALIESGMAPAEAAQVVREPPTPTEGGLPSAPPDDAYAPQVERLVLSAARFDVAGLKHEIARSLGYGNARTIYHRVLAPALERLQSGEVEPGPARVAVELVGNAARQLWAWAEPSAPVRRALLASVWGEGEVTPLYGLGLTLSEWECQSVILGADVDPDSLAASVAGIRPDVVVLWMGPGVPAERRDALLAAYHVACEGRLWAVAGAGAQAERVRIESHGGRLLDADPAALRALMRELGGR